ncbi:MAG: DUF6922 domain-containing protein [Bacteroidia bacterium]
MNYATLSQAFLGYELRYHNPVHDNYQWVICRVLDYGGIDDFRAARKHYGDAKIIEAATKARSLDIIKRFILFITFSTYRLNDSNAVIRHALFLHIGCIDRYVIGCSEIISPN